MSASKLIYAFTIVNETIRRVGGKWKVYSKDGSKLLGTHDTKKAAQKQLAAIEIAKGKR